MASAEQLELSTYIKNVHSKLREESKIKGFQKAWEEHCTNEDVLRKYSRAMKSLATEHWRNNHAKLSKIPETVSRIEWVYKYCTEYFQNGRLIFKYRRKEIEIGVTKLNLTSPQFPSTECEILVPQNSNSLRLLDVGSCYNPFKVYEIFDITAIDIAPACPEVHRIDFINNNNDDSILKPNFFDIVVFSLFLEYLPDASTRLECCEKAYKLLKPEGLLFIVTPDSKHVGANSRIIQSWRFVLAELGFSRIKYEKLKHIHCMVFRKSLHVEIASRWAKLHENKKAHDSIYIVQDFKMNHENIEEKTEKNSECWDENLGLELPGFVS